MFSPVHRKSRHDRSPRAHPHISPPNARVQHLNIDRASPSASPCAASHCRLSTPPTRNRNTGTSVAHSCDASLISCSEHMASLAWTSQPCCHSRTLASSSRVPSSERTRAAPGTFLLDRRTCNIPVRAEHAAVAFLGLHL